MNLKRAYRSRIIEIGKLKLGGDQPVLLQSMTNTSTLDVRATVEQSKRILDMGAHMVRITARNVKEAGLLEKIKSELIHSGYDAPLIADIHFNPDAAEVAARIVEKVRINPGNYVDRGYMKTSYSDAEYEDELHKIRDRLSPLIQICKDNGTAIRIGTNHGSLSNRILLRYGNTVEGMAESAMEFIRICNSLDFQNLVLSMKSSDVKVMVYSTRLLVKKMKQEGFDFPLHLGVTEAGSELDGRIRSAAGIGCLLADGIGDTIRVSLTESPENEIPVAINISSPFEGIRDLGESETVLTTTYKAKAKPLLTNGELTKYPVLGTANRMSDRLHADLIYRENKIMDHSGEDLSEKVSLLKISGPESLYSNIHDSAEENGKKIIAHYKISEKGEKDLMKAVSLISSALIDGHAEGVFIEPSSPNESTIGEAFSLLQFLKLRVSKTEFISCPTCGRTQFDMEGILMQIKRATSHLKGLKIAVMGCIVNGPGEMADADYGYVGASPGKVNLYRGQKLVKSNVSQNVAVEKLIRLIKKNGDWFDA